MGAAMTTTSAEAKRPGGARVHVQRFGTFLSGMIMPNIAAFIAWGLLTALFIDTGWLGNTGPVEAWRWADSAMLGGGTTPKELHFYDLTTGQKVGELVPPERAPAHRQRA